MDCQGKTYFVTGATGYLGSKVVRAIVKNGNNVFCMKRRTSQIGRLGDIEDKIAWIDVDQCDFESFFSTNAIAAIVHCATNYGRKAVNPINTIDVNLVLPLKLLHAAANAGVSAFINTDTILDKGINNYSLSKAQFVDWLKVYSTKICGINMALQHFYGPGDDPTKFATFIIQSLLQEEARIKLTTGEQKRDFIFVDDVVEAILTVIKASEKFQREFYHFEVGSGNTISIREFVLLAKNICKNKSTALDFGALPYRKGEIMDVESNILALQELGWVARTSVSDGLAKMATSESKLGDR